MRTLLDSFLSTCREHPERPFFETASGASLSYGEAASRVLDGVHKLQALDLVPGDRVIGFLDQTVPCSLMLLASGFAKTLIAPLSPVFSDEYIASLAKMSSARAILTTDSNLDRAQELGLATRCCDPGLLYPSVSQGGKPSERALSDLAGIEVPDVTSDELVFCPRETPERAIEELSRISPPDLGSPFLIQPTSGSTGHPKLVVRPYRAFARYAQHVGDEVAKARIENPRVLAVNALTHAFAGHMFAMALRFGATILVPSELDFRASLAELRRMEPNILPMTPRVLQSFVRQWHRLGRKDSLFSPSARILLSAGGRADPASTGLVQEQGIEVIEFYGSSEASLISVTPYGAYKSGAAGRPAPDVELKRNSRGELLVKSPGLMLGYYGDSELTELVFDDDGFLRTGDIAEVRDDGYLQILGRRRDVFNTLEGTNIFPERLETMLESIPLFDQAILVGDGKPYVTAHIALRRGQDYETDPDGFIRPEVHGDIYATAGLQIESMNDELETIEQVVAISLYARPFPEDVYRPVSAGKFSKNRKVFLTKFGERAESLYKLGRMSAHLVPPQERRFDVRSRERTARSRRR